MLSMGLHSFEVMYQHLAILAPALFVSFPINLSKVVANTTGAR